jgi:hypothetical protein
LSSPLLGPPDLTRLNNGHLIKKVDSVSGTENSTYNNANRLLSRGTNNYTNDNDGNTLTGGGRTNAWDSQNLRHEVA